MTIVKRVFATSALTALALSLVACGPAGVDQIAAQEWLSEVSTERENLKGLLGTSAGLTSPETTDLTNSNTVTTLTPGAPVTASKAEALCFGGLQAELHIMVNTQTTARGLQTEVPCDGTAHSVDLGTDGAPLEGVEVVKIDMRAPAQTTYYVDVYL